MFETSSTKVAIIGLGYVGLPLAVEFSKKLPTTGFDLKDERIAELQSGLDVTREVTSEELAAAENLEFTSSIDDLQKCNVFIVAVPTPIDDNKR
ncbi:MAG: Vi polysaccharide biosynthesis UDP-N-acetylglucosamine C-6 dehydrogenase TviB, partial [Deltaproteobacteria bacterium]|nr:Vi polysaccharide biosynthesis UDP-N-acetylglucosamine C-6 dehydrogenase TviB [Deltaproteobacteria bacterium]